MQWLRIAWIRSSQFLIVYNWTFKRPRCFLLSLRGQCTTKHTKAFKNQSQVQWLNLNVCNIRLVMQATGLVQSYSKTKALPNVAKPAAGNIELAYFSTRKHNTIFIYWNLALFTKKEKGHAKRVGCRQEREQLSEWSWPCSPLQKPAGCNNHMAVCWPRNRAVPYWTNEPRWLLHPVCPVSPLVH